MKYLILASIIFGVIISCQKNKAVEIDCNNKSNQIDVVKRMIAGTYDWIYTKYENPTGGDIIIKPSDINEHRKYTFQANGNFSHSINDSVLTTGTYTIDYEFRMTNNPSDSATIYILTVPGFGILSGYDQLFICTDSAMFYRPHAGTQSLYTRN